jgi:hypothetical protein
MVASTVSCTHVQTDKRVMVVVEVVEDVVGQQ